MQLTDQDALAFVVKMHKQMLMLWLIQPGNAARLAPTVWKPPAPPPPVPEPCSALVVVGQSMQCMTCCKPVQRPALAWRRYLVMMLLTIVVGLGACRSPQGRLQS